MTASSEIYLFTLNSDHLCAYFNRFTYPIWIKTFLFSHKRYLATDEYDVDEPPIH